MSAEVHGSFRELMDRRLAGDVSAEEERALGEHLAECADCAAHMEAGRRAVAGLNGFSFEAGAELNAKVMLAIRERALEIEERRRNLARWMRLSLIAVVLTVVGSVVDLRLGHLAAAVLDLQPWMVRESLLALWIVPSFGLLLLFPVLPLLAGDGYGKRRML
ncbi:MAG: zf-HC2 domain-containing protein [Acidobacteriaceae bacterium]